MKQIFISGITGKVGKLLSTLIINDSNFNLVGGSCSPNNKYLQKDIGELLQTAEVGIEVSDTIPDTVNPDVIIDFSTPEASMKVLKEAVSRNIPILIGTTGFEPNQIEEIEYSSNNIAILFAPNTSPGIAILKSLLNESKKFFSKENKFQISETHHTEKRDAPSGTALDIQKELLNIFPDANLKIESFREGNNPGEHTVSIAMENEVIELKHMAKDRSIFALGALKGAMWLSEKPAGLYHMQDIYSS